MSTETLTDFTPAQLQKLAAARFWATRPERAPFLASALYSMVLKPAVGLGTFAVSEKLVCVIDPAILDKWTVAEVGTVLVHEVSHPLRKHHARAAAIHAEPRLWNLAVDAEINDDFDSWMWSFPTPPVTPDSLFALVRETGISRELFKTGLTAEAYYRALVVAGEMQRQQEAEKRAQQAAEQSAQREAEKRAQQGEDSEDSEDSDSEDSDSEGSDSEGSDSEGEDSEGSDSEGAGQGEGEGEGEGAGQSLADKIAPDAPKAGSGYCGSGAGRATPDAEEDKHEGRSEVAMSSVRQQVAAKIQEMGSGGRGMGSGGWKRFAEEVFGPSKVRWQDKLARAVRRAVTYSTGMGEYTYQRPHRRQADLNRRCTSAPILPSMRRPMPSVSVALDTSGSMGTAEMTVALSELDAILKAGVQSVEFMSCDAKVHGIGKVRKARDAAKLIAGGGGTDFRPVFEACAKSRPNLLVFVTDGMGTMPAKKPDNVTVVWLLVGRWVEEPKWGEVIRVEA